MPFDSMPERVDATTPEMLRLDAVTRFFSQHPERWCQGTIKNGDGQYCLIGRLLFESFGHDAPYTEVEVVADDRVIYAMAEEIRVRRGRRAVLPVCEVYAFNDDRKTTIGDLIAFLGAVRRRLAAANAVDARAVEFFTSGGKATP